MMKKEKIHLVVEIALAILLMMNFVSFNGKDSEPVSEITRVVSIYKDGEGGPEVLSLTPQGWLDFIRTYPECKIISNLDFEEMFNFKKVENFFPEEAVAFKESKDLEIFDSWTPEKEYEEDIYCTNCLLSFLGYRDGIKFRLSNPCIDDKVDFTVFGASSPKIIYNFRTGYDYNELYYLVFDMQGKTMAISDDLEVFELTAKE